MTVTKFIALLVIVFAVNIIAIRWAYKRNNEKADEVIAIVNSNARTDSPAFLTEEDMDIASWACAQVLEDFLTEHDIRIPNDEREEGAYDEPAIMDADWHILEARLSKALHFYILRKGDPNA